MIKIHLLRKCILINVTVIKLQLEQIDYHEADVYQLQELKHQSKSLKTCNRRDMEREKAVVFDFQPILYKNI